MTEQIETISAKGSTSEQNDNKKSASSETIPPSTPERTHRSSSSSSNTNSKNDPIIPSTPPLNSRRKFSSGNFQSPGDLATNPNTLLPPATPSMSSTGKFRLSNVPETPFSAKSTNELTTSPLKSPSQFKDNEDSDKPPIRQISSTLKARLSYAFVKYQHGWANQSLDELEKTIMNKDSDLEEPFKDLASSQKSRTYEEFWNNTNGKSPQKLSPSKVTKPNNSLLKSPTKVKLENAHSVDQLQDDGSANLAFLQAISKSRSPKRRSHLQNNLRIDASKFQQQQQQNPEADAVETLMSLSSPQSFKPKTDSIPQQNLPRQRLSFGDHLIQQSPRQTHSHSHSPHHYQPQAQGFNNHRHPHHHSHHARSGSSNDNAIETESDTEYEESNTTDEEDVSTQSHSNGTKTENDEDEDVEIRTSSGTKSPES